MGLSQDKGLWKPVLPCGADPTLEDDKCDYSGPTRLCFAVLCEQSLPDPSCLCPPAPPVSPALFACFVSPT